MKSLKFLFVFLLLSPMLRAQEAAPVITEERRHNRIYFNMFDFIFSTFSVAYERDIKRNALMVLAGGILSESDTKTKKGGMGEIQYRFNMIDEKAGYDRSAFFYFTPYAQFKYIDAEESMEGYTNSYPYNTTYTYYSTANLRSYNAGAMIGLSLYALKGRFCSSFYAGGGLRYVDVKGNERLFENNIFSVGYSGVLPRFGFQLGIGF